jgi:hypothetical protein
MIMAGAYCHPPGTALICPEALNERPIARILPPESTSWPRAGIGILKPGLLVVAATDVIFGLLSPGAVPGDHTPDEAGQTQRWQRW